MEGERLIALAERGIIVVSESTNYDLRTADGRKQFRDAMTAAAHESDKISERTSRGKRKKAQRGKSNASFRAFAMPGYLPKPEGWSPGDLRDQVPAERVQAERDALRDLARRLLASEVTYAAAAAELNDRGLLTVMGNQWEARTLTQMLKRPSLAGLAEYKDEVIEGKTMTGEPALDREVWESLQARFASRRRGRTPARYEGSGVIRCGLCGATMQGRPRTNLLAYSDGSPAYQYWCQRRPFNVGCGRLVIDGRYTDDVVKEAVIARLSDPRHADQLAQRAAVAAIERGRIEDEINEVEAMARTMAEKAGRGEMKVDRYLAFEAGMDARLARLRSQLAAVDGADAVDVPPGEDVAAVWAEAVETGNLAVRRRMIQRSFPNLAIRPATNTGRRALSLDRFDWTGECLADLGTIRVQDAAPVATLHDDKRGASDDVTAR